MLKLIGSIVVVLDDELVDQDYDDNDDNDEDCDKISTQIYVGVF